MKRNIKRTPTFSSLTHLKAALVGWLEGLVAGWLERQSRGGGGSSRSNLKNQFRFSVPKFALSYKVQCRKRPNQRQNGQLLLSGCLKRELPWQTGRHVKGGESASVLSVWVLPVRRLGTSGGGRGLPYSSSLGPVPVILAWRGHTQK